MKSLCHEGSTTMNRFMLTLKGLRSWFGLFLLCLSGLQQQNDVAKWPSSDSAILTLASFSLESYDK